MTEGPAEENPVSALPRRSQVPGFLKAVKFRWPELGWIQWGFLLVVAIALGMRLWELGGRAMHYDEAIHLHYSWRLLNSTGAVGGFPWIFGKDFIHSPWMHGPFQIEFTAIIFRIFGDTDFTSRLGYALFGAALAGLPYFLRDYIGRTGAVVAGLMLTVSPAMLYFSRFGRNDILMAFWATALFILMWRYMHEGKNRYLYIAAVVLAFMFGTKETAYIVTLIFGALAFLLALPQIVPWILGRERLSNMAGPAGFFLLLFTLTLPQWIPIVSLAQNALGLTLANVDSMAGGLVGAPQWEDPSVLLPVLAVAWWIHLLVVAVVAAGVVWLALRLCQTRQSFAVSVGAPLLSVAAASLIAFRPIDGIWSFGGAPILDLVFSGVLAGSALSVLVLGRVPWARGVLLWVIPAQLALGYAFFLTTMVNVDSVVNGLLPSGISVDASANAVPVNYIVAGGLLLGSLNVSLFVGVLWLGGRWLILAGIFYLVWVTIYTTVFTNLAGTFSGVWQGMGYWIAQQDVARGNQPWYYYFVGLSIYEILPVAFGIAGAVYFLKKFDVLGLALTFWAVATLIIYTSTSEKMPWLLVNISLPFILLSAKYLGHLVERVQWSVVLAWGHVALLALPPLTVGIGVFLLYAYSDAETSFGATHWAVLASAILLAVFTAYLMRLAKPRNGGALATLGLAGLLLAFGIVASVRASYTFDDSSKELLVYAQGSKDVPQSFGTLENRVLANDPKGQAITVDYDLWYPFNWYARDAQRRGSLHFKCFKEEGDDGWNEGCQAPDGDAGKQAFLLSASHSGRDGEALSEFEQEGPLRNLLWFNEEAYRRPGENRQDEGSLWGRKSLPSKTQLTKDFGYFKSVVKNKEAWFDTLDYLLFRNLTGDWYNSEFYSYLTVPDSEPP